MAAAAPVTISTIINVVSGVFGSLGLASFATEFAQHDQIKQVMVNIGVGLTADATTEPDDLMGNAPDINAFSLDGSLVGTYRADKKQIWAGGGINSVNLGTVKGKANVGAEYVAIYGNGDNPICISAVSLKNPNDNKVYGWFADIGVNCGMPWHLSDQRYGSVAGTKGYKPPCVWITGLDSTKAPTTGFSIHVPDFSEISDALNKQYEDNHATMCGSPPRFQAWSRIYNTLYPPFFIPALQYGPNGTDVDVNRLFGPGVDKNDPNPKKGLMGDAPRNLPSKPVPYTPPPSPTSSSQLPTVPPPAGQASTLPAAPAPAAPAPAAPAAPAPLSFAPYPTISLAPEPLRRRASPKSNDFFDTTLIKSSHPEHSAKMLCNSHTSLGPDFVSEHEGLFCDMQQKQLWPVCSADVTQACFDTTTHSLRIRSSRVRRSLPDVPYKNIKVWK